MAAAKRYWEGVKEGDALPEPGIRLSFGTTSVPSREAVRMLSRASMPARSWKSASLGMTRTLAVRVFVSTVGDIAATVPLNVLLG